MKLIFAANTLTEPTQETFEEIAQKSFRKIERLIDENPEQEAEIRISVEKNGNEYLVTTELRTFKRGNHITKTNDRDIRKAVNEAAKELKSILRKDKDKKVTSRAKKALWKIRNIFGE